MKTAFPGPAARTEMQPSAATWPRLRPRPGNLVGSARLATVSPSMRIFHEGNRFSWRARLRRTVAEPNSPKPTRLPCRVGPRQGGLRMVHLRSEGSENRFTSLPQIGPRGAEPNSTKPTRLPGRGSPRPGGSRRLHFGARRRRAGNLDRKIAPQVAQRKEALDSSPRRLAMCKLRCDMAIQHSREMQSSLQSLPAPGPRPLLIRTVRHAFPQRQP